MDCNGNGRGLGTLSSPQRNHYFYGKLMDVPHFEMEQRYGIKKQWLINRLGLGYGVLCGLKLTVKDKKVCVSPGVAIDRYGREIVLPHEVCIDPWTLTDECGRPQSRALPKSEGHEVYLCLAYKECQTDFMPVLVTDCNTKQDCLSGTTVESYSVLVLQGAAPPLPLMNEKVCEILRSDRSNSEKRKELCELISAGFCSVADDISICVVLGSVSLTSGGTIDEKTLDQCSARTTLVSNEDLMGMLLCLSAPRDGAGATPQETALTRISGISWTHDGEYALKAFPSTLEVTFSHQIRTFPQQTGRAWFVVTLEWLEGAAPSGPPAGPTNPITMLTVLHQGGLFMTFGVAGTVQLRGKKATFTVDPNQGFLQYVQSHYVQSLPDPPPDPAKVLKLLCRVVVKCDFLLDQKLAAVDGDHLGGGLPSGDGVPGGDFESWFKLNLAFPG